MFNNIFNQKKTMLPVVQQTAIPVTQVTGSQMFPGQSPSQHQITGQVSVGDSSLQSKRGQDVSLLTHLDSSAAQVLERAEQEAIRIKQALIQPEQILLGLLENGEIIILLTKFSADSKKIAAEIQSKEIAGNFAGQPTLSEQSKKLLEEAYKQAKNRNVTFITPHDILLALFAQASSASQMLTSEGIFAQQVAEKLSKTAQYVTGKRSVLSQFGTDLTQEARDQKLDPVTGRDMEIERLTHILLRRTKNNPIVIGESGVGKTALIEGLAQNIVRGAAPKDLLSKKIIQIDLSALVAGASHRGEFEERLRDIIKETQLAEGQIILFIDEIHTLIGAGDTEGSLDASNIIKPFLARGQLQIIGTTTQAEFRKYFEKDKAFARRFQPILIEEPDEATALLMMKVLQQKYENFHKVTFPEKTLKAAVHLSKRYVGERFLPDKAVDLLDEAGAEVRLLIASGKRQDAQVEPEDIQKAVSAWTGIPLTKLTESEGEKLLQLEDTVHKRLIDQTRAVSAVSEAVRRGRIGLSSANRPIASFIFLGPTGVGKTELAKVLAEIMFGRDDATIRLDMSEFMEKHEVAKLIGAPPGYVGYEEGGRLTEAVRSKPYSIVLLDEIEKAHPDVFNILLQILEDGRATDNKGNTISFKNTIIIATSNIGSTIIQEQILQDSQNQQQEDSEKKFEKLSVLVTTELRKFFKPEILNRFDEIVIFEPLALKDMAAIARLGINSTKKLLVEQGIDLDITQDALKQLAQEGYDPMYGARPLRRLIQTAIENPIAVLILNNTFSAGDVIQINYDSQKEQFTFIKASPASVVQPEAQAISPQPIPQSQQIQSSQQNLMSQSTQQQILNTPIFQNGNSQNTAQNNQNPNSTFVQNTQALATQPVFSQPVS